LTGRTQLLTIGDKLAAIGGAEIAQLTVVEGLASAGWSVDLLYVTRGDLWPRWDRLTTRARRITASQPDRSRPLRSSFGTAAALVAALGSRVDVVYVHNPGDLPVALAVAGLTRVPVVVHLHLPPPFHQPEWMNWLIRRADAVITPSGDAAERWVRTARLDDRRITVVPTGVDTTRFNPIGDDRRHEERRLLGIEPGTPTVLYAGRLDVTKGLDDLIEAMGRLDHAARLVVCGDGVDRSYVEHLHRSAGGLDVVWLSRRLDVSTLMAAADVVVLPSTVAETQGMVVTEAMACGTPAVATAVGGIPEILADFSDRLVPPGDPAALAAAISRLLHWRTERPDIGPVSSRWVGEHLSVGRTVDQVSTLLATVEARAGSRD
jgi:glycosyltransferase involved in cell wall biosynthesis